MAWNYMQIELIANEMRLDPMIGPGGLTRDQAHWAVESKLQQIVRERPSVAKLLAEWTADETKNTLSFGRTTWVIYEADDPVEGAADWIEEYARTLERTGGLKVSIAPQRGKKGAGSEDPGSSEQ